MNQLPEPPRIYQLRIVLREISPLIWRRLLVCSDTTLAQLHTILQIILDWTGAHSIGFSGGQLSSYVEGSSALDFPLVHDARSPEQPRNKVNIINRLKFYH